MSWSRSSPPRWRVVGNPLWSALVDGWIRPIQVLVPEAVLPRRAWRFRHELRGWPK